MLTARRADFLVSIVVGSAAYRRLGGKKLPGLKKGRTRALVHPVLASCSRAAVQSHTIYQLLAGKARRVRAFAMRAGANSHGAMTV